MRSIFVATIAALCATTAAVSAQVTDLSDDSRALHAEWMACLKEKTAKFSRGRDAADIVANGVVAACDLKLHDYVTSMRRFEDNPAVWAVTQSRVISALQTGARNGVLQDVLLIRSKETHSNARHR